MFSGLRRERGQGGPPNCFARHVGTESMSSERTGLAKIDPVRRKIAGHRALRGCPTASTELTPSAGALPTKRGGDTPRECKARHRNDLKQTHAHAAYRSASAVQVINLPAPSVPRTTNPALFYNHQTRPAFPIVILHACLITDPHSATIHSRNSARPSITIRQAPSSPPRGA
jgi:hypothetical protein